MRLQASDVGKMNYNDPKYNNLSTMKNWLKIIKSNDQSEVYIRRCLVNIVWCL